VCQADEDVLVQRLARREIDRTDRADASDARLGLWSRLRAAFLEPTEMSEMISVSTGDSPGAAVARAMAFLSRINRTDAQAVRDERAERHRLA
jgi:hypothetical protein